MGDAYGDVLGGTFGDSFGEPGGEPRGNTLGNTLGNAVGDAAEDVTRRLRGLAVDLVRGGKPGDAAAVLVGVGAVELLATFATTTSSAELSVGLSRSFGY